MTAATEWPWASAAAHVGGHEDWALTDLVWWREQGKGGMWEAVRAEGIRDAALAARLGEAPRTGRRFGSMEFRRALEEGRGDRASVDRAQARAKGQADCVSFQLSLVISWPVPGSLPEASEASEALSPEASGSPQENHLQVEKRLLQTKGQLLNCISILFALLPVYSNIMAQAQSNPKPESETATVKLIPVTTSGATIHAGAFALLRSVGPNEKYERRGADLTFHNLPFGLYEVTLQVTGFNSAKETIGVYQSRIEYRVGLVLWEGHSNERPRISGTVSPVSESSTRRWIRLVPLYSGRLVQNSIDRSGRFLLIGVPPGRYLILVFGDNTLLHTEPLEYFGGTQNIKIELRQGRE